MAFEKVFMNFEVDVFDLNQVRFKTGTLLREHWPTSNVTVPSKNQNVGWGVGGGRGGVLDPAEVAPVGTGATRTYRLQTHAVGGDPQRPQISRYPGGVIYGGEGAVAVIGPTCGIWVG